ncbi:TAXI family TRAP transporter solute-binding subunit [Roseinatronobacter alkalisoli]|uniref:TAXI family TRAP transporter solute-binding subunit n=1 Tax=Roseinatronobacter alkalisoli TaxID=3028235 RepID=A0ABT5T742_9RHOB|nr:TAXI family TRAP transporter solute-binding subunit [Roseinatronobacter sp. HJB301]MDD7970945.1 TAXI family TRAP transporter solute-binding subunit [Roseinatronobacter sp. HJB301]
MYKRFLIAAIAAASTFAATVPATAQERITIGTNPQGTLYYTIAGGLAAALQETLARQVTVQPFTGSSVYIPLIDAGEVTLGLNSSIDVGAWYRGEYGNDPYTGMRVLARLWPLRQALTVRADSGMTEVADLAGKRVITSFSAQAATGRVNTAILEAGGLQVDDVEGVTVAGLQQGINALIEDNVDATGVAVGIPLTQQAHATIPGGIRYLSITGAGATDENLDSIFNGVYLTEIAPNPRMPEITEPVTVSAYDVFITVSSDLSDADATAILTALYDALPGLKADYPPLAEAAQDRLSTPTNTVPYHPAAVAFFKDRGLWSDENEVRETGLE